MSADGSSPLPLTKGCISSYSPNGKFIAFTAYCDGSGDILLMNADGSDVRNLTNGVGGNTNPSWSRDGSKVIFQSDRDGATDIYMMNPDGTDVVRLTFGEGKNAAPVWQPQVIR
jgi:TolB protein